MKKGGKNFPKRSRKEYVKFKGLTEELRWRDREAGGEAGKGIRNQTFHRMVGPFKDLGLYPETNGRPL